MPDQPRSRGRGLLRRLSVRGLVLAAGVAGILTALLGPTLFAGLDLPTPAPLGPQADRQRMGPMTAIQPDLRPALISDQDLPQVIPSTGGPEPAPSNLAGATSGRGQPAPEAAGPAAADRCRALFEDPAGLAEQWPTIPVTRTISRQTPRGAGTVLRQVLAVFAPGDGAAAFRRFRETARGCTEFAATLDGEPVTVLLREEALEAAAPEAPAPEAARPEAPAPEAPAPEATRPEAPLPEATAPEAGPPGGDGRAEGGRLPSPGPPAPEPPTSRPPAAPAAAPSGTSAASTYPPPPPPQPISPTPIYPPATSPPPSYPPATSPPPTYLPPTAPPPTYLPPTSPPANPPTAAPPSPPGSGSGLGTEPPREEGGRWRPGETDIADETYAMTITVLAPDRILTGWLSVDRVGPVVSVLRQLGPGDAGRADQAETRRLALRKLHALRVTADR